MTEYLNCAVYIDPNSKVAEAVSAMVASGYSVSRLKIERDGMAVIGQRNDGTAMVVQTFFFKEPKA